MFESLEGLRWASFYPGLCIAALREYVRAGMEGTVKTTSTRTQFSPANFFGILRHTRYLATCDAQMELQRTSSARRL
jgi:hypothetical protein